MHILLYFRQMIIIIHPWEFRHNGELIKRFFLLSLFSATSGGILDRAIEAEDKKHGDFLRLVTILYFVLPLLPTFSCCMYYHFERCLLS